MIIFKNLKVDFTVESGWFCACVCVSSKTLSKHVASCVASDSEITTATSASSGLPIPGQGDFLQDCASFAADAGVNGKTSRGDIDSFGVAGPDSKLIASVNFRFPQGVLAESRHGR